MQDSARAETGKRKAFFENSRWLVLHLVFLRLHPERSDILQLTNDERKRIGTATNKISEILWNEFSTTAGTAHPKTIFSNPADCKRMKVVVLNQLNTTPALSDL